MITTKYTYTKCPNPYVNGTRIPSVTKLLEFTKSPEQKQALLEWKNRVGDTEATRITQLSTSTGTTMHSILENYIKHDRIAQPTADNHHAHMMGRKMIEHAFRNINEYWGSEVPLYYPELYTGTTDCVGLWKTKPAIIDFKNSINPKKAEWVEDYILQGCGYAHAHNELYGTDIRTVVVLIMTHNLEYQEFVAEGNEFDRFSDMWFTKVSEYYGVKNFL
jgi:genome maintenance exonuclease 1